MSESQKKNCPICNTEMKPETRERTEIDVCADHGVWLDSGELEALLIKRKYKGNKRIQSDIRKYRKKGVWEGSFFGWLALFPFKAFPERKRERHISKPIEIRDNPEVPEGERKCPVCGKIMYIERRGVMHLDICPDHGIWFDSGELLSLLRSEKRLMNARRSRAIKNARQDGRVSGAILGFWALLLDN